MAMSADEKRLAEIEYRHSTGGSVADCDACWLLEKLKQAREATAPLDGDWEAQLVQVIDDAVEGYPTLKGYMVEAVRPLLARALKSSTPKLDSDWEAQLRKRVDGLTLCGKGVLKKSEDRAEIYISMRTLLRSLLARARQEAALAALAKAADYVQEFTDKIAADGVRALPVEGTSLADHDAALVAGIVEALVMTVVAHHTSAGPILSVAAMNVDSMLGTEHDEEMQQKAEHLKANIRALTPAGAQRWLAEFERKVRLEEAEWWDKSSPIGHTRDCSFDLNDASPVADFCDCNLRQRRRQCDERIAALRPPSPAGEPQAARKGDATCDS